jgi:hypothetical protein
MHFNCELVKNDTKIEVLFLNTETLTKRGDFSLIKTNYNQNWIYKLSKRRD